MAMKMKNLQLKLFISNKYAYAQVVNMLEGKIVASASTIEKAVKEGLGHSAVDKSACSKYVLLPFFYLSLAIKFTDLLIFIPIIITYFMRRVGEVLAQRAAAAGIEGVSWQRKQGQKYHGRIASLIESMKQSGLKLV